MQCRICASTKTFQFLSLGHQPPSDAFLTKEQLHEHETTYPLDVYFCDDCKLVQLGYTVDPKVLFNEEYAYNTGTSKELVKNFSELTESLTKRFGLTEKDLAVDIGANDGTLLEGFQRYEVRMLGVEPSGIARLAQEKKIPIVKAFFNLQTAGEIVRQHGKATVVTATNVFAHVDDLAGFVEGVKLVLADDGVFISESHYLLNLIEKMQYDSIYHEHLRYYSLGPLRTLFQMHGMEVFDAELITTHGGSIRVYACKKGAYQIQNAVEQVVEREEKAGLYRKETFLAYQEKVAKAKETLVDLVWKIKKEGHRIVGIGAPAKGNTLLNYCRLTPDLIDYLAEKSQIKMGRVSPGMHIPVVDEDQMLQEQPAYGLLLSWNLKDIIVPKLRAKGYKGTVIVPIPEPVLLKDDRV